MVTNERNQGNLYCLLKKPQTIIIILRIKPHRKKQKNKCTFILFSQIYKHGIPNERFLRTRQN